MKKTILFLGAGMSATLGYPLTADILPRIIKKINTGRLFNDVSGDKEVAAVYRTLLRQLLISLSPGIAPAFSRAGKNKEKTPAPLPVVTELLSQLDELIGSGHRLVDWNFELGDKRMVPRQLNERWELTDIKTLFDWAIINVINHPEPRYSPDIRRFLRWIKERNSSGNQFISIVSSNYDTALESELLGTRQAWNAGNCIDFGCSWRDTGDDHKSLLFNRPVKPVHRIFKLHGSTDWLKCDRCGFIYINPTVAIYDLAFPNKKQSWNTCHCGYWPLRPVLITPSFVRKVEEVSLKEIWRNAFEEIRTADEWIITGYSLPAEDFDIRSLFLRAMQSNEKDIYVKVIQLSSSSQPRYDMFFGAKNYEFVEGGFEKYIPQLINPRTRRKPGIKPIKAKKI